MRPLLLTMKAFGPFREEQTVDFRQLGGSFFLIQGPTGAGKTSLLDAMCYALYGRSTGDRDTYRSHHAGDEIETRVVFEFALGSEVYRAERRLTKKGNPMPTLQRRSDSGWESIVSRKEISKKVEELLGFNLEQFRRVVMLPQGQFARFLLAPSGEKEGILNTLFRTGRYEQLTAQLNEMQQSAGGRMKALEQGRMAVLDGQGISSVAELEDRIRTFDGQHTSLQTSLAGNAKRLGDLEILLAAASEDSRRREELRSAEKEWDHLSQAADRHSHAADELARADRAASLEELVRSKEDALTAEKQHQVAVDESEKRYRAARERWEVRTREWQAEEARAPERDSLRRDIEAHRRLEPELRRTLELEGDLEKARAEEAATLMHHRRLEEALQGARLEAEALEGILLPLRERAAGLSGAKAERDKIERLQRLLQQRDTERQEAERLEAQLPERLDSLSKCRSELEARRQELRVMMDGWKSRQIGLLAAHLKSGHPCPVCGSMEHPAPAAQSSAGSHADAASSANEKGREHLEEAIELDQAAVDQLQNRLRDLERDIALHRDRANRADSERSLEDPDGAYSANAVALTLTLQQAVGKVDACESAVSELAERTKAQELTARHRADLERQCVEAREAVTLMAHRCTALEAGIEEKRRSLPSEWRDPAAVLKDLDKRASFLREQDERAAEIRRLLDEARTEEAATGASLQSARAALEQAMARYQQLEARLAESLKAQGFSDEEDLRNSRLNDARREELRRNVADYERRCQVAQAQVEKARAELAGRTPVDVAPLESERAATVEAQSRMQSELGMIAERIAKARQALQQLEAFEKDQSDLRGDWQLVSKLYDAASGRSGRKITLQRYVLAYRLEEVLGRASERLRRMTHGRYALRRADISSDARRTAGLDLEIFDASTGRLRPVSSLSGGESFLASLSLALALAEVVQARTGGIRLDTIFIDEGFGSLDPEALDLAVGTLKRLQEGGRMVGIISHVDELKNQIPAQIEVHPGPSGSHVRIRS